MNTMQNKRAKLRIAKSDLADTNNTKLLQKYPHLDDADFREQLKATIKALEGEIAK